MKGNIIPSMRYEDAPAAIEWLQRAFGFVPHLVVPDENGGIAHAQLVLGEGMIMLGSHRVGDGSDQPVLLPKQAGGITQSAYIYVEAVDDHYRRAVENGADIVYEIADQDYGGRLYAARDPEGHIWHFGSYDPWGHADG